MPEQYRIIGGSDVVMEPVKSSNLKAVGYDKTTHILVIQFVKGYTYQYYGVSEYVYNNLMIARSKGVYFRRSIKRKYDYWKVAGPKKRKRIRTRNLRRLRR